VAGPWPGTGAYDYPGQAFDLRTRRDMRREGPLHRRGRLTLEVDRLRSGLREVTGVRRAGWGRHTTMPGGLQGPSVGVGRAQDDRKGRVAAGAIPGPGTRKVCEGGRQRAHHYSRGRRGRPFMGHLGGRPSDQPASSPRLFRHEKGSFHRRTRKPPPRQLEMATGARCSSTSIGRTCRPSCR